MKIFRKIRQTLIKEGSMRKYLIYAIGEILLVMIGILLAFQVNSWNTQRIKEKNERISYQNIKRQINDDKNVISGIIDYNNLYYKQYEYANQVIEQNDQSKIDTLGKIALKLYKYSDYNRSSNIYQNLMNSGELKLLKNRDIIEQIQRLEETYIYMNRMEKIHFQVIMGGAHWDIHKSIKFSDGSARKPEKLFGIDFQNHFIAMMGIMIEKDEIYHRAINEIEIITKLIDEELNSDIEH
jgi:hypothetical protein